MWAQSPSGQNSSTVLQMNGYFFLALAVISIGLHSEEYYWSVGTAALHSSKDLACVAWTDVALGFSPMWKSKNCAECLQALSWAHLKTLWPNVCQGPVTVQKTTSIRCLLMAIAWNCRPLLRLQMTQFLLIQTRWNTNSAFKYHPEVIWVIESSFIGYLRDLGSTFA